MFIVDQENPSTTRIGNKRHYY